MRFAVAALVFFSGLGLSAAAQSFTGAMSGSWWDASRSGEGQFITFESTGARNVVYLAYFTYTPDGRATWHVGNVDYTPGAASISIPLVAGSGARFGGEFKATDVRVAPAGTATLEFVSCTGMRMRHSGMDGVTLNLTRLVGPLAGAGCGDLPPAAASLTGVVSGSWWNAARSGEGQFVTFETLGARNVASVAYFTYDGEGLATWLFGNADVQVGATSIAIPVITGSGARFGAAFRPGDVRVEPAGTVTLTFSGCESLTLAYSGAQSFTHALTRLVGPLTGFGCPAGAPAPSPQADGTQTTTLASMATDFTYPIMLYFPPGYIANSGPHPVIYALDSEFQFMLVVEAVRVRNYNAIVVGIGNGGSARRFIDFVGPGWTAYHRFLTRQLMPYIETQYRVDRTRRTLMGYSLSGSFAGVAMSLDDPAARHFAAFIAIDGSYWSQTDQIYLLESNMFAASRSLPVTMFHAGAANRPSITGYRERLEARGYTGFRLRQQDYPYSHSAVLPHGINDGLAYVFDPAP